jgi:hypothetical protein
MNESDAKLSEISEKMTKLLKMPKLTRLEEIGIVVLGMSPLALVVGIVLLM